MSTKTAERAASAILRGDPCPSPSTSKSPGTRSPSGPRHQPGAADAAPAANAAGSLGPAAPNRSCPRYARIWTRPQEPPKARAHGRQPRLGGGGLHLLWCEGLGGVEEGGELLLVQGFGEVVALAVLAAQLAEPLELVEPLDTFGDGGEAEGGGQVDDGLGERGGVGAAGDLVDERLVDLEDIDGQAAKVAEGGVAGAEIVDRQPHPQAVELGQGDRGGGDIGDQQALGQLQGQVAGLQAGGGKGLGDLGGQVGLGELDRGQVDADAQLLAAGDGGLPVAGLLAGAVQHPGADRDQQAGLLGKGDEAARGQQPPGWVLPAHQRLQAGDPPAGKVNDRLLAKAELVAVQGAAQIGLQLGAVDDSGAHARVEDPKARSAVGLGLVHGHVGVTDQVERLGARPGDDDADAGVDLDVAAGHRDRRGQCLQQPLGGGERVGGAAGVLDQDDELVAAEPGDGVAGPYVGAQPLGDQGEQLVADLVSEGVVDGLERVQVQQQHGQQAAVAVQAGQGVLQPVVEQRPVGQVGEWVVQGLVVQLLGQALAFGDVGGHADHPGRLAVGGLQWRGRQLHLDGGAVAAVVAQLQVGSRLPLAAGGGGLDGWPARLQAGRVGSAQDLLGPPAVDAFGGRVPQLHPPAAVQLDDGDWGGVDDRAEPV